MGFLSTVSGDLAMTADQLGSLQPALAALLARFRCCFKMEPTFRHWEKYLLGLMADLKRKSIEPIALAAGVPVRTLQEFLAFFAWDHDRVSRMLQQLVMDEHESAGAIGVIDASGHAKQGDKTPGVQRQWCGETGKLDNCVVGQHLLYTNNDAKNPFTCMLASDLYLSEDWANDRERCRAAGIPEELKHRPKWQIALDQLREAIGNGVRFSWVTFDEDYGAIPAFWFGLDALGVRGIGEVRSNFRCWPAWPRFHSPQRAHAAKRVDNVCRFSPVFTEQSWKRVTIKQTTRGPTEWEVKTARVYLVDTSGSYSQPTDRRYWLIVARNPKTKETKYFVSNASGRARLQEMLEVGFGRWHIEMWFERAKQEAGLGAFEVRNYTSLMRHWLCSRIAMYFLASQTERLRGEKSAYHAGAGGGSRQRPGGQDLEPLLAFMA
ncbi:MAG: IS701 family transposase [Planctomycetaceae bacterium]|nr:MAG: IS701 family transposase [Planctomycetaceae bacterium]